MSKNPEKEEYTVLEEVDSEPEFDRIISTTDSLLVSFTADWCGPYRSIRPVLEEFAIELDALVLEVNIEDRPKIANRFEVNSVPTFLAFDRGCVSGRLVGRQTITDLQELLEEPSTHNGDKSFERGPK